MDMYFDLAKIFIPIIITAPLSYWFGVRKTRKEFLDKNKFHRYKTAYVPYIETLYKGFSFNGFIVDNWSYHLRTLYFDLINKNLSLWGENTISVYEDFYQAYLDMLEYDDGNITEYLNAPKNFEICLTKISLHILEEAKEISDSLGLPPLAKPLIANYRLVLKKQGQAKFQ